MIVLNQTVIDAVNAAGYLDVFFADDTGVDFINLTFTVIPEPSTAFLLASGLVALAAGRRRMGWRRLR